MGVKLRLPAKPGSTGSSSFSAVVGAPDDALSLVLSKCAKERDEATANRCGQVKVGFVQYRLYVRRHDWIHPTNDTAAIAPTITDELHTMLVQRADDLEG